MSTKYIDSGAQISPCEKYRFSLWRVWDESRPMVAFVGLNPSTADARKDDPTIRRCVAFANASGYGALTMLNLWAFRSPYPADLNWTVTNEEGINLDTIIRVGGQCSRLVAAWGTHGDKSDRAVEVLRQFPEWWCLGTTKGGQPRHPLYVKATQPFVIYRAAVRAVGEQT